MKKTKKSSKKPKAKKKVAKPASKKKVTAAKKAKKAKKPVAKNKKEKKPKVKASKERATKKGLSPEKESFMQDFAKRENPITFEAMEGEQLAEDKEWKNQMEDEDGEIVPLDEDFKGFNDEVYDDDDDDDF